MTLGRNHFIQAYDSYRHTKKDMNKRWQKRKPYDKMKW